MAVVSSTPEPEVPEEMTAESSTAVTVRLMAWVVVPVVQVVIVMIVVMGGRYAGRGGSAVVRDSVLRWRDDQHDSVGTSTD